MRLRFNAAEKAVIAQTLDVEVHYGSGNWIRATLDDAKIDYYSNGDQQRIMCTVTGPSTRTIGRGDRFGATPGNIRPVGSGWAVNKCKRPIRYL